MGTYFYFSYVYHGDVEVYEGIFPDVDVAAVVASKGWEDLGVFAYFPEEFFTDFLFLRCLGFDLILIRFANILIALFVGFCLPCRVCRLLDFLSLSCYQYTFDKLNDNS